MAEVKVQRTLEIKVSTWRAAAAGSARMVCPIYHDGVVNAERASIRITDKYGQSLFQPIFASSVPPWPPAWRPAPMMLYGGGSA